MKKLNSKLLGVLAAQLMLMGTAVSAQAEAFTTLTTASRQSEYCVSHVDWIDSRARNQVVAAARKAARSYIQNNSQVISVRCEKVRLTDPQASEHWDPCSDTHPWRALATVSVECQPRNLADEAMMSFAVTCEKAPTQECIGKLMDPSFADRLRRITPTEFDYNDDLVAE